MRKSKAEIIKEMTEIIVSARKIREEYASSARPSMMKIAILSPTTETYYL
jgi:hypothetical protein